MASTPQTWRVKAANPQIPQGGLRGFETRSSQPPSPYAHIWCFTVLVIENGAQPVVPLRCCASDLSSFEAVAVASSQAENHAAGKEVLTKSRDVGTFNMLVWQQHETALFCKQKPNDADIAQKDKPMMPIRKRSATWVDQGAQEALQAVEHREERKPVAVSNDFLQRTFTGLARAEVHAFGLQDSPKRTMQPLQTCTLKSKDIQRQDPSAEAMPCTCW